MRTNKRKMRNGRKRKGVLEKHVKKEFDKKRKISKRVNIKHKKDCSPCWCGVLNNLHFAIRNNLSKIFKMVDEIR